MTGMQKLAIAILAALSLSANAALADYHAGPIPPEFGLAGQIPQNPDMYKAVAKHSKDSAKLGADIAKCYSRGVRNVTKGRDSGINSCINHSKRGVLTKYLARVSNLSPLPWCLPSNADLAQQVIDFTKTFQVQYYCESPSGAFLDAVDF